MWANLPHTVDGKPDVIRCEDALEACILYGIELGMIWSRHKTACEKWESDKKIR